jgi:hypothetical protein
MILRLDNSFDNTLSNGLVMGRAGRYDTQGKLDEVPKRHGSVAMLVVFGCYCSWPSCPVIPRASSCRLSSLIPAEFGGVQPRRRRSCGGEAHGACTIQIKKTRRLWLQRPSGQHPTGCLPNVDRMPLLGTCIRFVYVLVPDRQSLVVLQLAIDLPFEWKRQGGVTGVLCQRLSPQASCWRLATSAAVFERRLM